MVDILVWLGLIVQNTVVKNASITVVGNRSIGNNTVNKNVDILVRRLLSLPVYGVFFG
jgi:hypothetical protein